MSRAVIEKGGDELRARECHPQFPFALLPPAHPATES